MNGEISVLMGGRVAEEIFFNRISTGAANDIERATAIARRMVCDYGMSDKLGPLSFGQGEHEIFLGKDFSQRRDFSEETARVIDGEVQRIVMEAYAHAKEILHEKREILVTLAEALLVRETLDASDVLELMRGGILPPKPPAPTAKATVTDERGDTNPGLDPVLNPA
jgi:cell division protease FtsH